MIEYPITFSVPMVPAILDGRKTMTRRLARHPGWRRLKPSDRLWVRETWCEPHDPEIPQYLYRADTPSEQTKDVVPSPWRSPIYMPRAACRIWLVVTAIRFENLHDITEADAMAEGAEPALAGEGDLGPIKKHRTGFVYLWDSLHGPGSWLENPEVVAITFRRV